MSRSRLARAACCAGVPLALSATLVAGAAAQPAVRFADLDRLWSERRYGEVLPLLKRYRSAEPYGKNELVDYMIATSACRVAGEQELGRRMFVWILAHYSLNPEGRELVRSEQGRCPPSVAVVPVNIALVGEGGAGPASTSGTRGKLYYMINRGADVPMANEPVGVERVIPIAELEARLFPRARGPAAAVAAMQRAGTGYRAVYEGDFLMVSSTHAPEAMREIARGLGRYLDFFAKAYRMPRPPHLVTVYLTPDGAELREMASRVHGIRISRNSIGYSFRDDLSMVGIIPGQVWGTLAHELFHLMVRRDFGDVPPWLDEGLAALYEVSQLLPDGRVAGRPNWRGRVLVETWFSRPAVAEVVTADWQAFEASGDAPDPVRQAANHATARYLVLYLQEQGLLQSVYKAFRDRDASSASADPQASVRLLESVTGRTAAELDAQFEAWFKTLEH